jgi:membrane protease YdiL (CAAX protease family)
MEAKPEKRKRALPEFLNVPWHARDVLVFAAAWVGIQIVVVAILHALGPVIPSVRQFLSAAAKGTDIQATFVLDLLDAAAGFGVVALYLRKYKVGWSAVGWRKVGLGRAAGYLLGILALFYVLASGTLWLVSVLVPSFNANQAQQNDFIGAAPSHHSLALFALVILPPILEETIFRGFMFAALAKRWGVVWGAILSSAIFGLAHAQANISIYTFLLGLLLCFMYVRLRSIVPGMFLHALNNYLAFIALSSR